MSLTGLPKSSMTGLARMKGQGVFLCVRIAFAKASSLREPVVDTLSGMMCLTCFNPARALLWGLVTDVSLCLTPQSCRNFWVTAAV